MEEGTDYYFNDRGLMVFTEVYHLKRGYCCGNGCLHCPWSRKAGRSSEEGPASPGKSYDNAEGEETAPSG